MPKYRMTRCQDEGYSKGCWFYTAIDLRKKYYFCNHCQKEHLVKDGVAMDDGSIGYVHTLQNELNRRRSKILEHQEKGGDWK